MNDREKAIEVIEGLDRAMTKAEAKAVYERNVASVERALLDAKIAGMEEAWNTLKTTRDSLLTWSKKPDFGWRPSTLYPLIDCLRDSMNTIHRRIEGLKK